MVKFKVGDIVRATRNVDDEPMKGKIGTIKHIDRFIRVEWDDFLDWGHDCNGYTRMGHGWNVKEYELEHVNILNWKDRIEEVSK